MPSARVLAEKSKTCVVIFMQVSQLILMECGFVPLPVVLLKLMLISQHQCLEERSLFM